MIDDTDTYIVRDVLTDDLIFLTPDDLVQNSNGDQTLYDNQVNDSEIIDEPFPIILTNQRLSRQFSGLMFIESDDELETNDDDEK